MNGPNEGELASAAAAETDWAPPYARAAGNGVFVTALIAGFAEGASSNDAVRLLTAFAVPWTIAAREPCDPTKIVFDDGTIVVDPILRTLE